MQPAQDFPEANFTFTRPAGTTEAECADLRCYRGEVGGWPCTISKWEPTEEERRAIAEGGAVYLFVYGDGHPPVAVSGTDPLASSDSATGA